MNVVFDAIEIVLMDQDIQVVLYFADAKACCCLQGLSKHLVQMETFCCVSKLELIVEVRRQQIVGVIDEGPRLLLLSLDSIWKDLKCLGHLRFSANHSGGDDRLVGWSSL